MLTAKFDQLVKQLRILPGVGQKSAQRMALHLLTKKRPQGMALAQALDEAMRDIVECSAAIVLATRQFVHYAKIHGVMMACYAWSKPPPM